MKEGSAFEYVERVREGDGPNDEGIDRRPEHGPPDRPPWPHHHWVPTAP